MTFAIPIVIEESPGRSGVPVFSASPVFGGEPSERGEKLARVVSRLTAALHRHLLELSQGPRQDRLALWTQEPNLDETTVELRLELESGSAARRFFLVGRPALGRRIYFAPRLPAVAFEVLPGQDLKERAQRVFTRHFRDREKSGEPFDFEDFTIRGSARLSLLEVTLEPAVEVRRPKKSPWAQLAGDDEEKPDGDAELRRTSQHLNSLYPDDLDRAVGRDESVGELLRFLSGQDRRPVLLLGPRKVGKTAVLHEAIRRMEAVRAARKSRAAGDTTVDWTIDESISPRHVWHVSPMRLISGMSVVGQWETRVEAILAHATARDLVLYVDDLPGLFTAGVSSASDLNVAALLKPCLERRSVRVVAEITPEAWRVLCERDRSLADLFHVMHLRETSGIETSRILIAFARDLEAAHRCEFRPEVIPTVCALLGQFARDAAFPGKAAGFLRRLATAGERRDIRSADVFSEFASQTGLGSWLVDPSLATDFSEIVDRIAASLSGQPAVVEAFAVAIAKLKARLNDSARPLGVFLLLGPTGVGKTQSAKALAAALFGDANRLLRFDMNEFVDASAVGRLVGTAYAPDGLLSSAIRRQPFNVVLLDEIEKASPEVFDLLLGVLDEGRLTDALGRVSDFTNTFVLLTSNLGVREAGSRLGFATNPADATAAYVSAAEKFFRPEFFNRIDAILPFNELDPAVLQSIASGLIAGVMSRIGLLRRECTLRVLPEAARRLVALGHHPQLGARALKRTIERELTAPLAEQLTSMVPGVPHHAQLGLRHDRFEVVIRALVPIERSASWSDCIPEFSATGRCRGVTARQVLDAVRDALDRIEASLGARSEPARIEIGNIRPEQEHAIYCREQIHRVDALLASAADAARSGSREPVRIVNVARPRGLKLRLERSFFSGDPRPDAQRAAESFRFDIRDVDSPADPGESPLDSPFGELLRELAMLEAMASSPVDEPPVAIGFRTLAESPCDALLSTVHAYLDALEPGTGCAVTPICPVGESVSASILRILNDGGIPENTGGTLACHGLLVRGPGMRTLLSLHTGLHLVRPADPSAPSTAGPAVLVHVELFEAGDPQSARTRLCSLPEPDLGEPWRSRVVRMDQEGRGFTDYRSGLRLPPEPTAAEWRAALLSSLPLPPEVAALIPQAS